MSDLFQEPKDNSKDVEELRKEMAELKSKFDTTAKEREQREMSWQEEKARLEGRLKEVEPWAETAKGFSKLVDENPEEAMARIVEYRRKKAAANQPKTTSEASSQELEAIKKELAEQREYLKKEKEEQLISEFHDAVQDAVNSLASEGIDVDDNTGREILQYMKTKKLSDPSQVDIAARTLYSEPLLEARIKAKTKKGKAQEAVVMGTSGYADGETPERTEEESSMIARPEKVTRAGRPEEAVSDKLWKMLEKSI